MSYQEVYNGLNKKASNEQIKKLASIIGMRKKAADAKAYPKGKAPEFQPRSKQQIQLKYDQKAPRGWAAPQNVWNQWAPQVGLPKGSRNIVPGATGPQQAYLSKSLQARNMLNPYGAETAAGKAFNKTWGLLHDWKTGLYRDIGFLPYVKENTSGLKFGLRDGSQNAAEEWLQKTQRPKLKEVQQNIQPFEGAINRGLKQRIRDPKDPIHQIIRALPKEKQEHYMTNPMDLMLLLSKNTRKPSYSQQLNPQAIA